MHNKLKGTVLAIFSAIIFGTAPLFAKAIYSCGSNAMTFTVHRTVVCTILLFIVQTLYVKEPLRITWNELKKLFICSIGFVLTPILLYSSYNYISSGLSTTIHFVYPVLVVICCLAFFREKLTVKKAVCCVLCMAGIVCFYTPDGSISFTGILIAFLSGITYTFYVVYLDKSGLQDIHPIKLGFWLNLLCSVEVIIASLCMNQLTFDLQPIAWGASILFAAICCAAVIAFQEGVKYVGSQSASLLSAFEPVTSVVLGILVFHEQLTFLSALGIVSILVSVILLSAEKSTESE